MVGYEYKVRSVCHCNSQRQKPGVLLCMPLQRQAGAPGALYHQGPGPRGGPRLRLMFVTLAAAGVDAESLSSPASTSPCAWARLSFTQQAMQMRSHSLAMRLDLIPHAPLLPRRGPARTHRSAMRVPLAAAAMRMLMRGLALRIAAVLRRMRVLVPVAAVGMRGRTIRLAAAAVRVPMRVAMRRVRMAVPVMVMAMGVGVAVPRVAVPMLAQDQKDDHVDGHAAERQEEHYCAQDG